MPHNFNKKSFLSLVGEKAVDLKEWELVENDRIFFQRYNLHQFELNYENMILDYIEACGSRIARTNHNTWSNMFWVWYTKPTISIDPSEFFDNWEPTFRWKSHHSLFAFSIICVFIFTILLTASLT